MAIMDRVRRGEHDLTGLPDDLRALVAAALHPDPAHRPAFPDLIERLGGDRTVVRPVPTPRAGEDDPFTVPLALANGSAIEPTRVTQGVPPTAPPTAPPSRTPYAATRHLPTDGADGVGGIDDTDPDDLPVDLDPGPARESAGIVLRRGLTVTALGVAAASLVTAWPYAGVALLLTAAWLLRTCTMTVTAAGDRRRLRGTRWYDVLLAPLSAPWYLVASLPGALLLGLWSLGLALAGTLLCYAAGASTVTSLFLTGLCLVVGLWWGPGAAHVRWPVRVVAQSLARRIGRWAVVTVVVVATAGFIGHQATLHVGWSPFGKPPLVGR
jgi:hypothetical protein